MDKCTCCGKETDLLLPDPRDCEQEYMVCEACEYEITERASHFAELRDNGGVYEFCGVE